MSRFFSSIPLARDGSHMRIDGVSFAFGDRRILTDVSFIVSAGDRVGVIGENGAGKSTLLRVLAGVLTPSAGTVTVNLSADVDPTVGLLHQRAPFAPNESIGAALETAVTAARLAVDALTDSATRLSNCPDDPGIAEDYARALDAAERLQAWDLDARIAATLSGLGLGLIDRRRATGSLSGGQRARLALGWLLLSGPDVLLLDEPTNHLDDAATEYLTAVITSWRGPVLMASHDRTFLDEAATSLLDLDPSPLPQEVAGPLVQDGPGSGIGATRFSGTYSDYLQARADAGQRWDRQYRDEQAHLARLRAAVKSQQTVGHATRRPRSEVRAAQKFHADRNAKVIARRVNDARARLETLHARQIRKPPAELEFRGLTVTGEPVGTGTSGPVLTATKAAVDGRLAPTSLGISRGEKWLITGANGVGKSTLLGLFACTQTPTTGHVTHSAADRVGLLTQETHLADPYGRGPERTVSETYTDLVGTQQSEKVGLSMFGLIAARDYHRPVDELSVGQQRRLALAILIAAEPEILLLDEPTNHFSLTLVTTLETALMAYPGTVVIASHDRWLRTHWNGHRINLVST